LNFKKFIKIGLKIAAAAIAGFAAFVGIGQIFSEGNSESSEESEVEEAQQEKETVSTGIQVVEGLRKTQDVTGKFITLVQSITMVAENVVRMFDKSSSASLYNTQPQYYVGPGYTALNNPYNNPWVIGGAAPGFGIGQNIRMGDSTWTRVDTNIIEAR
jgi:hypothetical protein